MSPEGGFSEIYSPVPITERMAGERRPKSERVGLKLDEVSKSALMRRASAVGKVGVGVYKTVAEGPSGAVARIVTGALDFKNIPKHDYVTARRAAATAEFLQLKYSNKGHVMQAAMEDYMAGRRPSAVGAGDGPAYQSTYEAFSNTEVSRPGLGALERQILAELLRLPAEGPPEEEGFPPLKTRSVHPDQGSNMASSSAALAAAGTTAAVSAALASTRRGAPSSVTTSTGGRTVAEKLDGEVEVMEQLAAAVDRFGEEIETALTQLRQAADSAAEGWRDKNYDEAASMITEMASSVQVSEAAAEVVAFIRQKAAYYAEG